MSFHHVHLPPADPEARQFRAEQRKSLGFILAGFGLGLLLIILCAVSIFLSPS